MTPAQQGFSLTLTTDKTSYTAGEPVNFTFTVTNISDHPVDWGSGPSIDVFTIDQNGTVVWQSETGFFVDIIVAETLAPGASETLHAVWDGSSNMHPLSSPTGTFDVHFGIGVDQLSTTFTVQPAPPQPVSVTLTTDQAAYTLGQPVNIALTVTNTSNQDVTIAEGPDYSTFAINLINWGKWDSVSATENPPALTATLHPGESYTLHAVWNEHAPSEKLVGPLGAVGAFDVQVPMLVNGTLSFGTAMFVIQPAAPPVAAPPITTAPVTAPPTTTPPVTPVVQPTLPNTVVPGGPMLGTGHNHRALLQTCRHIPVSLLGHHGAVSVYTSRPVAVVQSHARLGHRH